MSYTVSVRTVIFCRQFGILQRAFRLMTFDQADTGVGGLSRQTAIFADLFTVNEWVDSTAKPWP